MDTKNLYDNISTKSLPTYIQIKDDVAFLRYDFEISVVDNMIGDPILADLVTKCDSPPENGFRLTSGLIYVDLSH